MLKTAMPEKDGSRDNCGGFGAAPKFVVHPRFNPRGLNGADRIPTYTSRHCAWHMWELRPIQPAPDVEPTRGSGPQRRPGLVCRHHRVVDIVG